MSLSTQYDVIIIGGGLVGQITALALANHNMNIAIIEKNKFSNPDNYQKDFRATALSWSSVKFLSEIIDISALEPYLCPIKHIKVMEQNNTGVLNFYQGDREQNNFYDISGGRFNNEYMGYIIQNHHFRKIITETTIQNPNISLYDQANIILNDKQKIHDTHNGIISLSQKSSSQHTTLNAPLIIIAEGKNGLFAKSIGYNFITHDFKQSAIVCTIHHSNPNHNIAWENFFPAGPFALLPLKDDDSTKSNMPHRTSLVWSEQTDMANHLVALAKNNHKSEFEHSLAEKIGGRLGDISVPGAIWGYPLTMQWAQSSYKKAEHNNNTHSGNNANSSWHIGRTVLIGDIAHTMHPIAGQGLNIGIDDIKTLSSLINRNYNIGLDYGNSKTLNEYITKRRYSAGAMVLATASLNSLFSNDLPLISQIRSTGLSLVNKIRPLSNKFMQYAAGQIG